MLQIHIDFLKRENFYFVSETVQPNGNTVWTYRKEYKRHLIKNADALLDEVNLLETLASDLYKYFDLCYFIFKPNYWPVLFKHNIDMEITMFNRNTFISTGREVIHYD